jgi:hypothetical protein
MKVKDLFFRCGSFQIGNEHAARFWEDTSVEEMLLDAQYPCLQNITRRKNNLFHDVLLGVTLNVRGYS